MRYIQGRSRSEIMLHPHIDSRVHEDNVVRLIDLIVDKTVAENPEKMKWKGNAATGRSAYSPNTMLKLLLYGYFNRIAGSRRLEQETYRNVELMWLLGDLSPDHWTICAYRRENKEQIRCVTLAFRNFLKANGYIKGTQIVFDGSKFKANANRDMFNMDQIESQLINIEEKLEAYLNDFRITDSVEDLKEELISKNPQTEINEAMIKQILDLKKQVEELSKLKALLADSGKNYIAANDPEANLMKSQDVKGPGYNAQLGVDAENKMIVLGEITDAAADRGLLKDDVDKLKAQLDIVPSEVIADQGYSDTTQIQQIEALDINCCVPLQDSYTEIRDKKNSISFIRDSQHNQYLCSEGKPLKLLDLNKRKGNRTYSVYQGTQCTDCAKRSICTKSKKGRILHIDIDHDWIQAYKKRLEQKETKNKLRSRRLLIEHPFGTIKLMMGKLHFLLTGKEKTQIEFDLYATNYNIKRLINLVPMKSLLQQVDKHYWKMA